MSIFTLKSSHSLVKSQHKIQTPQYSTHLLTHASVGGHVGCFRVLAIVNATTMNIRVHVSFWITILSEPVTSSGIAGP